jgi:hypothetical protein
VAAEAPDRDGEAVDGDRDDGGVGAALHDLLLLTDVEDVDPAVVVP